jgi:pyruvate dehydrogenase E1 component alpha subunit
LFAHHFLSVPHNHPRRLSIARRKEAVMPRELIQIPDRVEYIQVLDDQGRPDPSVEPALDTERLLELLHFMLLGRRFDERQLSLQRQGRMGTFPPISGQEAAQLGAVAALTETDWMVPSFRETAAEIFRGRTLESVLLANNGYSEGGKAPDHAHTLPVSVPVGSQLLHAVGIAWAMRYRGTQDVVMTFFGDGATSEGDFHEALNFAGVYEVPVVFVCQNNQWAISVPRARQTRAATLAQKAIAYGIVGVQVDGNDILAVYLAATEAVARARQGLGATLIECVTYRMGLHTTADDPKRYRDENEVTPWKAKDPLPRFQNYLKSKQIVDDDRIAAMEAEITRTIAQAVERAETQMRTLGGALDMFAHVYAELPPNLVEQRREVAAAAEAPGEVEHG